MSWGEVQKAASARMKCSFRGGPGLVEPPVPLHPWEGGEGVQISVLLGTPLKDLQNWGFVSGLRLVGRTQDARRQAGEGITASGGGRGDLCGRLPLSGEAAASVPGPALCDSLLFSDWQRRLLGRSLRGRDFEMPLLGFG